MATETRIYTVSELADNGDTTAQHLVRAASQAQAIRAVCSERFIAEVATQDELVSLAGAGKKVLDASAA
jgi:hypothetical protein